MTTQENSNRNGKIITFYSYKGGTGRSMALANIAWVLANSGKRVLMIDWDLEAPGLHRYFEPFLPPGTAERGTGVIDFVRNFATAAVAMNEPAGNKWYENYSDLIAHAVAIEWEFGSEGALHLVLAGKQDESYSIRVNSFDWQEFYETLGGGVLLELAKAELRRVYDFILIDSRTGVSDTSGICTIQMPDELVVCFTLNRQSVYGASTAARSAFKARHTVEGEPTLKIWPVTMRVESSEKDRLEYMLNWARARFSGIMHQLLPQEEDVFWGEVAVRYEPYYAYEEVLASFRDRPRQNLSTLAQMEKIAGYLSGRPLERRLSISEQKRSEVLNAFSMRSARECEEEYGWLAEEYENIRQHMQGGDPRTELMNLLVARVQMLGGSRDAGSMAEKLFSRGTDGARIVGLALAEIDPRRQHVELALAAISERRSPFEQYHGLLVAQSIMQLRDFGSIPYLQLTIEREIGNTITPEDPSRWTIAQRLAKELRGPSPYAVAGNTGAREDVFCDQTPVSICIVPTPSHVRYDDDEEMHGPWVGTRGSHLLRLPRVARIGQFLVTNGFYLKFIQDGGYQRNELWSGSRSIQKRFVTADGRSFGPSNWPSSDEFPEGEAEHPVNSICYLEALAFVQWCNLVSKDSGATRWSLPPEDDWEFAARSDEGSIYPWGDAFEDLRCNSAESGRGRTTPVDKFPSGTSRAGCFDMAGNVWEFVVAQDFAGGGCVLRGGSFLNNRYETRSYLRLFGVPLNHRAQDFGIRLAQVSDVDEAALAR